MQITDLDIFTTPNKEPQPKKVDLPAVIEGDDILDGDIIAPVKGLQSSIPLPLQGIDLSKALTRSELLAALTSNLPRNEYNFPRIIYRADLIDPQIFQVHAGDPLEVDPEAEVRALNDKYEIMQGILEAAMVPLQYFEGYPAFGNGEPIWARMPYETVEDYALFEQYRNLPGARQLALLPSGVKIRATELFHTCYWHLRCQAADAFATVHYQRQREQRILASDDAHFLHSQRLIDRIKALENSVDWEALAADPEKYVQTLERVIKIQRAALGQISPNGSPAKDGSGGSGTLSVEVGMRRITQQLTPTKDGNVADGLDPLKLLDDPEAAEMAQELILKIQAK